MFGNTILNVWKHKVYLFECCFSSHSRIFRPQGDVIIAGDGLTNLGFNGYLSFFFFFNSNRNC